MSRGASNVALGTAAAAIILIGLLWVLPFPLLLQSMGSLGIAVVAFAVPFLIRFPLATLRTTPDAGLAYLGHRLRAAGFRVSEEEGRLTIRTGPLVLLRLDARAAAGGCEVRYRVDLEPVGGSGYALLMGAMFLLVAGVPPLVLVARLRSIEARVLRPLVPADGVVPEERAGDAVRAALVDGISEAHRLAAEAYEATRARYWDLRGIVGLVGVLAGALLLLAAVLLLPDSDAVRRASTALPFVVAGGIAAAAPLGVLVRRRVRPALLRYREWADRLRSSLAQETAGAPAEPGGSRFELLLEASREVPDWIEARHRAGLSRDLGMWSLFLLVFGYELELAFLGVTRLGTDPSVALGALVGTVPFAFGLYVWWRWWARRQRQASERQLAGWNERFERVRSQMEQYLRDL